MPIQNPIEWVASSSRNAGQAVWSAEHPARSRPETGAALPQVQRITAADLREVLAKGYNDFKANRTDVVFLCLLYPVLGLIFARFASGNDMLPLLFPLASGFALVGPLAGVGLNEMSRQRALGAAGGWRAAFQVVRLPSFGSIFSLGLLLTAIFVLWLLSAAVIYNLTLGPRPPESGRALLHDVLTTPAGWTMTVVGMGVGFVYALVVFVISVVSFPMLLDRNVGVGTAVRTSVRVFATNPRTMVAWGLIIAAALLIGSIPLFIGLVIVVPVLGHATWHLYRKLVQH